MKKQRNVFDCFLWFRYYVIFSQFTPFIIVHCLSQYEFLTLLRFSFTFFVSFLQRRQVARSQSPPVAAPIASPARSASFRSAVASTQIRGHTNVTLVLGSHAGGLGINGSDGRSLLSSRPEVACVPLVTPAKSMQALGITTLEAVALHRCFRLRM